MKHLNIKWVPETFVIVSVTFAASNQAGVPARLPLPVLRSVCAPFTKVIVISGSTELRADVKEVQRQAA